MKKILYLAMCCLAINIAACSDSGKKGYQGNYQEACEDLDYSAAWKIVDGLKEEYEIAYSDYHKHKSGVLDEIFGDSEKEKKKSEKDAANRNYNTAFDYVLRSEVNFLIANGDEMSAKRIMVLLNEREMDKFKKEAYIKEFTKLAILLDNSYAIDLLAKNATIDDEELIEYMAVKNTKECSDKVLTLLAKEFGKCKQPSTGLHPDYYFSEIFTIGDDEAKAFRAYNSKLNMVLDMAISGHNQYLAQKVLDLYTKTVVVIEGEGYRDTDVYGKPKLHRGVEVDGNHIYIEFDNSEVTEARRKYDEAVKSGAFE